MHLSQSFRDSIQAPQVNDKAMAFPLFSGACITLRRSYMGTTYIFIAFGSFVWLFGIAMVAWHVRQHRAVMNDAGLSPPDFKFHESQYRRRMQTSALTITLGALIAMCDYLLCCWIHCDAPAAFNVARAPRNWRCFCQSSPHAAIGSS